MSRNSDRCGIFSWFGFELPLTERLKLIKETGFVSTSVWLGEEEELVKNGQKDSIPELVRSYGLFLENIHAPFNNLTNYGLTTAVSVAILRRNMVPVYRFAPNMVFL